MPLISAHLFLLVLVRAERLPQFSTSAPAPHSLVEWMTWLHSGVFNRHWQKPRPRENGTKSPVLSFPGGKVSAPVVVWMLFYLSLELSLGLSSRLHVTAVSVDIDIKHGLVEIQLTTLSCLVLWVIFHSAMRTLRGPLHKYKDLNTFGIAEIPFPHPHQTIKSTSSIAMHISKQEVAIQLLPGRLIDEIPNPQFVEFCWFSTWHWSLTDWQVTSCHQRSKKSHSFGKRQCCSSLTFLPGGRPGVHRLHVLVVCPVEERHVQSGHHLPLTFSSPRPLRERQSSTLKEDVSKR